MRRPTPATQRWLMRWTPIGFGGSTRISRPRSPGGTDSIVSPYSRELKSGGQEPDAGELAQAEFKDRLHLAALERVARDQWAGEPYVLLLRSFGTLSASTTSIHSVPVVMAEVPGVSVGRPLEARLVEWLENRAMVIAVAQRGRLPAGRARPVPPTRSPR